MLNLKKASLLTFIKVTVLAVSTLFVSANMADEEKIVQLAQLSDGFTPEATYMQFCFACHSTGAAGAPKVGPGNKAAWDERLQKGLDAVVANAISGLNAMPARGICMTCTDDEIRALVEYMIASSTE